MARIFISHSSKNNFAAIALRDWIIEGGWDHPFLDLDPERGIAAGERWERALHEAADQCEVVLFLVSREWLKSDWCVKEFNLAQKLNKRLFGVLINDLPHSDLPATLIANWQVVNLASGSDHDLFRVTLPDLSKEEHVTFSRTGLARLKAGLDKAGLGARYFEWPPKNDPDRSPYPGLRPLEAEDAGIFFGRDAPRVLALDRLRGLREAAPPRLFIIQGASGAGKSSFLRAGIIPRMMRDDAHFLPLPTIRPERAVISGATGLIHAIEEMLKAQGQALNRAEIAEAINDGASKLLALLKRLSDKARGPSLDGSAPSISPSLVLSIDQGEELFLAEGAQEARAFLVLLKELALAGALNIIILFTIRSDSYERLQTAKALEGVRQETFPLPPMPRGAFQTIIEGPAQRLQSGKRRLTLDPALTAQLLKDIEEGGGKDALPLLAFTLERLYREYGSDGDLRLDEYLRLGGIGGSIEAAVNNALKAADADPTIPKNHNERLALLRRAMIPALAVVDPDTRTPRRRVARLSDIPPETRGLIDCLVEARLLTTDEVMENGRSETTIEPAHEALLRQWSELQEWLKEDAAALLTLGGVQQAARDWEAHDKSNDWLTHSAGRLEDAERLREREDFALFIMPDEQAYLNACRVLENERRNREVAEAKKLAEAQQSVARRTRIGLIAVSLLAITAISAAIFGFHEADKAEQQSVIAEEQTIRAEQRSAVLAANAAQSLTAEGDVDAALLLLLDAARWFNNSSVPDQISIAFTKALQKKERTETRSLFPNMKVFETDDALLLVNPKTNDVWQLTDSIDPKLLVNGSPQDSPISKVRASLNGKEYIVLRENLEVERINVTSGATRKIGAFPKPKERLIRDYLPDGQRISDDGLVILEYSIYTPSSAETSALGNDEGRTIYYMEAFDSETGKLIQFNSSSFVIRIARKRPGGGVYAWSQENNQIFELVPGRAGAEIRNVRLSEHEAIRIRRGDCVANMPKPARAVALKVGREWPDTIIATCTKAADRYVLSGSSKGASAVSREDKLIESDGINIEIREIVANARFGGISANLLTWVGIHPVTKSLVVLLDRSVYVLEKITEEESNFRISDPEYWSLRLDYRHAEPVNYARFIGSERVVVVEAERGRLIAHDIGLTPRRKFYTSSAYDIVGTKKPIEALHRGTCAPSLATKMSGTLPDGRELVFERVVTDTESDQSSEVRIASPKGITISLGGAYDCIDFSSDWTRMLLLKDERVTVYDFEGVLNSGVLGGNEVGDVIVDVTSAFFLGANGELLITANLDKVTTDWKNRVLLWTFDPKLKSWKTEELYKSDNPVLSVEPDATGERLLLVEAVGYLYRHTLLYSVPAREVWLDLSFVYKSSSATFTNRSEIAVMERDKWTKIFFPFQPLGTLIAVAERELSPECQPPTAHDYKRSPCWPAPYR